MAIKNFNKKIYGLVMAIIGFICILVTALNYIFGWKLGAPPVAIGIVFAAVGMAWVKKTKK